MKNLIKRADIVIIVLVLAVSAAAAFLLRRPAGTEVRVYVDGELFGAYSLATDAVIEISGHNTLTIADGKVYMSYADCPDGCCVKQGAVSAGSIICLPNRVVAEIVGDDGDIDAVAGRQ